MSDTELPIVPEQQAFETLQNEVYFPVFFQKVAAAGYPVRNEHEAAAMIEMAVVLRQQDELERQKQANTVSPLIVKAAAKIGRNVGSPQPQQMNLAKEAQVLAANRPDLAASVLSLHVSNAARALNQQ